MQIREYSRPVELAQLHKTELDVTSLVFQKGIPGGGNARRDLVQRGVFQFGKIRHCEYVRIDSKKEQNKRIDKSVEATLVGSPEGCECQGQKG